MNIFSQLMQKPWLQPEGDAAVLGSGSTLTMPTLEVGLRFFLATISVLFTLLIIAYNGRIALGDDWVPMPDPMILWFNTGLLILSSIAMQRARGFARRNQIDDARSGLLAAGILALCFIAGQFVASYQLVGLGYFASSNPANAFFYLLTGLHAMHLTGGLFVWTRTNVRVRRGFDAAKITLSIELCTIYWHFLLLVWLILFSMMLVT